jgi:DNA polymerase-3 subunit alpha
MPIPRVDAIVAKVPEELKITIKKAIEKNDDLKKVYENDPEARELLSLAMKIEGLARNVGTHAAAVVIADRPLTDYVPLQHVQKKEEIITQWAMGDVERAGLLKMDFLGLRNLTILSKVIDLIEQTTGKRVDPYTFPLDDKEAFALLCRGETKGVFQLESGGIRDLLQRMKPDHFRDIIATNALYRPGPLEGGMVEDYIQVKHGRKKPVYEHAVMEEVLAETHGVMVYQEQVMRILNRLGGIALANAYSCIKAISKKKLESIAKFREEFIAGAGEKGMAKKTAEEVFSLIEKFAGYGFNKSHSTAYALIAYMTAYLKAHYKVEFMAALLSSDIPGRNFKSKDSLVEHIEDSQRMEITVLPPDINRSEEEFAVVNGKIAFALSAIKGCGGAAAAAIVKARKKEGPFRSLFDFCERLDPGSVNRGAIESLVKAGAFDSLGGHRAQWFACIDRALQAGSAAAADRRSGQMGLFGDDEEETADAVARDLPIVPPWDPRESLAKEKEVLGYYLTSHPLAEHQQKLQAYCSHTTTQAALLKNRTEVMLGGMIAAIKHSHTKNPKPGAPSKYAMFDLEDTDGMMRCICWPEQFAQFGKLIEADAICVLRGAIDKREGSEEANFIVNEVIPLSELEARYTRGIRVRLYEETHGVKKLEMLYEILRGYPGECQFELMLCLADGRRLSCRCDNFRVANNPEMKNRVEELLGADNIRLITKSPMRGAGSRV